MANGALAVRLGLENRRFYFTEQSRLIRRIGECPAIDGVLVARAGTMTRFATNTLEWQSLFGRHASSVPAQFTEGCQMTFEAGRVIAIFGGQMLKRLGVFRLRPCGSLLAMTYDAPICPGIGLLDHCCWNDRRLRVLLAVCRCRLKRRGSDEGTCRAKDANHDSGWNQSPLKSVQHGSALFSLSRHYAIDNSALLRQDASEFNVRRF
jgi:hypothetical protein